MNSEDLAEIIEEALRATPANEYDPENDMCPNCVTPWKCNGPHLPGFRDIDVEAVREVIEILSHIDRPYQNNMREKLAKAIGDGV